MPLNSCRPMFIVLDSDSSHDPCDLSDDIDDIDDKH